MADWPKDIQPFAWLWTHSIYQRPDRHVTYAVVFNNCAVGKLGVGHVSPGQARIGIYMQPDYRGQGIGKLAIQQCMDRWFAHGGQAMNLDVWAANSRAVALYQRLGFQQQSERWHAIPNHPDLLLLHIPEYHHMADSFRRYPPESRLLEFAITNEQYYASSSAIHYSNRARNSH